MTVDLTAVIAQIVFIFQLKVFANFGKKNRFSTHILQICSTLAKLNTINRAKS